MSYCKLLEKEEAGVKIVGISHKASKYSARNRKDYNLERKHLNNSDLLKQSYLNIMTSTSNISYILLLIQQYTKVPFNYLYLNTALKLG